ncbi:uncharacterized protein LOC141608090 [Silene latifolia]|uniref:uncharacterized protein LOC141608090 n=1 Tax=Silene latifolia TaxID=37657 RepID=UPI003D780277
MTSTEFDRFSSCTTAKEIWDGLELAYEGTSIVKKNRIDLLIQKYELFSMEPNETLDSMSTRFLSIINELKNLGRTFPTEDIARKVLRSLTKKWHPKVTVMEECRDLANLSYQELIGALMAHELTLNSDEAKTSTRKSMALASENNESDLEDETVLFAKRFRKKFFNFKQNKTFNNNKSSNKKSSDAKNSFANRDTEDDEESEDEEVANLCLSNISLDIDNDSSSEFCLMGESDSDEDEDEVVVKENNQWYLDSGCLRHMTGDKNLFLSLKPFNGGKVTFGDNKKGKVVGIGKIGNKVVFHSYGCRIIIEGTSNVILEGQRKRNVYMIDLNAIPTNSSTCMKVTLDDPCLWHKRSDEAIFVGYSNHSKVYKVFNKRTLCIEESVHVIFDENNMFDKAEQDDEEDMNEPDFRLFRDDPPDLEEEEKEIEGTNDELGNPSNEKNERTETIVDDTIDSSQKEKLESTVITNEAITPNVDPMVITESTITQGLDSGGTNSNSFEEGEPSSHDDVPENSKKWRYKGSHPMESILGSLNQGVQTRRKLNNFCSFYSFLSTIEPSNIKEALTDSDWVIAMQEELQQFEQVFVEQPPGFLDHKFQNHVYKLDKALYGLKQAPMAWYDRLSKFLLQSNFKRGSVDKTLFLKSEGSDLLVVQIYVDDIIFGSTNNKLCKYFSDLMTSEFAMSMMGELKFFLGLQIQQTDEGIMIHEQKYIKELIKKFGMQDANPMDTPIVTEKKLTLDEDVVSQGITYGCG